MGEQTAATGTRKDSGYARVEHDWYVEDDRSVEALFRRVKFPAGIHDPCCGIGTIPRVAAANGIAATGADLIDRAARRFPVRDFLSDRQDYPAVVCNPPFSLSVEFVRHALANVWAEGRVAIIAQAKFLFSQDRNPLFNLPSMERVLILSKRPSMPPGEMLAEKGEACRKGGFHDFCWCVWRVGKREPGAVIEWVL